MNVDPAPHADLPTSALDYPLPASSIATRPAEPRDIARMMVVHLGRDEVEHRRVRDLPAYLDADDALVFNTTAVLPARLIGRRTDTAGRVEGLFLNEPRPHTWRVMLRSNGRLRPGQRVQLLAEGDAGTATCTPGVEIELIERDGAEWLVRLHSDVDTHSALDCVGRTPLPPYILRARGERALADALDRTWYQTIYADASSRGSVAAPTAGLHFTPDLLQQIAACGVERIDVTLHVGAGTFRPVSAPTLREHEMHREWYCVSPDAVAALRRRREAGGRIIAVGTTTVRTLESLPSPLPSAPHGSLAGETDLLIAPPYHFRLVDGMLTNFHLPRSTLLALVGAMVGLDRLKSLYTLAVESGYRFYSYGDAMLLLP